MTFSRTKPAGWTPGQKLTATQVNDIDIKITKALDGENGGTYSPDSQLDISGAGLSTDVAPVDGYDVANKNYVDDTVADNENITAVFTLGGNGFPFAFGAKIDIQEDSPVDTGFSVASDEVSVPANGIYLVSVFAKIRDAGSTANPRVIGCLLSGPDANTMLLEGTRFSTDTNDYVHVSGTVATTVADYTTQTLKLFVDGESGASAYLDSIYASRMTVTLLRRT